jgi:SsrA-binding protein
VTYQTGTIAENRKARFDYEIIDTIESGIVLEGFEVKSAKLGGLHLSGSYGLIRGGEVMLFNSKIQPFPGANVPPGYTPDRNRSLLLNKKEIRTLEGKLRESRFALIPLRAFVTRNLVKIELGLGRSKRVGDKREAIKKRDTEREVRRDLKN